MAPDFRTFHGYQVDGDAVPRRVEWADDLFRRIYTSRTEWRRWHRETWKRISSWGRSRATRGDKGWHQYRRMVRTLLRTPIRTMEAEPHLHFHFKALEREIDGGTHSMRYNHRMRLVFRFETDLDGAAVVRVIKLSDHYA